MAINRSSMMSTASTGAHIASLLDHGALNRSRRHSTFELTSKPGQLHSAKSTGDLTAGQDFHRLLSDPLVLAPQLQKPETNSEGVSDLIEFLRNEAPPPDHFMSMPDHNKSGHRGRGWPRWRKGVRRSSSVPKLRPAPIRLPDTAVSGTTTGGHRHIAITIPLDALPMGDAPRSQYPVYQKEREKPNGLDLNPVRAYVNDKGQVTLLHTVKEDHAAASHPSRRSEMPRPLTVLPRTQSHAGTPRNLKTYSSMPPNRNSVHEIPRRLQAPPRTHVGRSSSSKHPSQRQQRSIGEILSTDAPSSAPRKAKPVVAQTVQLRAKPKDASDMSRLSRVLGPSRDLDTKPLPSLPSPEQTEAVEGREGDRAAPSGSRVQEKPLAPTQTSAAVDRAPSIKERRDRVRDRKRRDLEAHLGTKKSPKKGSSKDQPAAHNEGHDDQAVVDSQVVESCDGGPDAGGPTFVPIQVVCNLEPTPLASETTREASLKPAARIEPRTPNRKTFGSMEELMGAGATPDSQRNRYRCASNDPTPPLSTRGSPAGRNSALDRTSLSRRREWRATREKERQDREARAALQARARKLAMEMGDGASQEAPALDKEIMRLYEAYREHRFRDMERRLRRLERNGDVWLRALVPVLDSLNQSVIASSHEEADGRGWASDGEGASRTVKKEASKRTPAPHRRPSSAHQLRSPHEQRLAQKLEEVLEDDGESRYCSSMASDEVNGLDVIEPLMRELAGAAALKQMRSQELLHAY